MSATATVNFSPCLSSLPSLDFGAGDVKDPSHFSPSINSFILQLIHKALHQSIKLNLPDILDMSSF